MALSTESLSYLFQGMGSQSAYNELVACFTTYAPLSADTFTRLQDCLGENDIATNFQNALAGSYQLQLRDVQFIKAGFCLPTSALQSVLSNIAGGYNSSININYI